MRNDAPFDDTAEILNTSLSDLKKSSRSELIQQIINVGGEYHVAILRDDPKKRLFRGQVGQIQDVLLSKEKFIYSFVIFKDYKEDDMEYFRDLIENDNLLPLFCSNDEFYNEYSKPGENGNINTLRENWDSAQFSFTPQLELLRHNKIKNRFKVGQLVTIEVDFEQMPQVNEKKSFIIQAGQVGIISKTKINDDKNFVEVTFWAINFEVLATMKKDFLPSSVLLSEKQAKFNRACYAFNPWEKKSILIKIIFYRCM